MEEVNLLKERLSFIKMTVSDRQELNQIVDDIEKKLTIHKDTQQRELLLAWEEQKYFDFDWVKNKEKVAANINKHLIMQSVEWDTDLENIGLPSNMHFSSGSEFGDIVYRLQKTKNIRWCVFSIDRNYYIIEQHSVKGEWVENWTKQMNRCGDEAKTYAEKELVKYYTQLNTKITS